MLWSLILISLIGRARINGNNHETAPCNASGVTELNGTTSQSSNYTDEGVVYSSERAFGDVQNCSHTKGQSNSWWRIDLLGVYTIYCISIFNKDHRYSDLTGAQIYIGNSREKNGTTNHMLKRITNFTTNQQNDFFFDTNVSGRYITVFNPDSHFLVLCSIRIFGTKKDSPFKLIEKNKTWVGALEHCRAQDMHLASIVDGETQTWAELEARNSKTAFVWLGLRYTCVFEFWFWVEDLPVEFSRWAPNSKIDDCNMSGAMKKENHLWFKKSEGDKFNFICAK